uniref:Uncharacterized protein n=1 Tax=Acrobeloides nanus TaxID=290746 RepID=A0A914DE12_9BILA
MLFDRSFFFFLLITICILFNAVESRGLRIKRHSHSYEDYHHHHHHHSYEDHSYEHHHHYMPPHYQGGMGGWQWGRK